MEVVALDNMRNCEKDKGITKTGQEEKDLNFQAGKFHRGDSEMVRSYSTFQTLSFII